MSKNSESTRGEKMKILRIPNSILVRIFKTNFYVGFSLATRSIEKNDDFLLYPVLIAKFKKQDGGLDLFFGVKFGYWGIAICLTKINDGYIFTDECEEK